MGVQDRDWYREALRERERAADGGEPARLPRKPAPTWLIVMAWVVAGRKAAAERGVVMGRPPKLDKAKVAKLLAKGLSQSEIARRLDAHPSSVNRCVRTLNGNPRRDKWHPKPSWACV